MEILNVSELINAGMSAGNATDEICGIHGHYDLVCTDENGTVLWEESADNVVVYTGKNQLLNGGIVSLGTTDTFLGLIGSGTVTAVSDTMSSHPGWIEAGGAQTPVYGTSRPALALSAPVSGVTNNTASAATYIFTNAGTVQGAFAAIGANAGTVDNTTGTLISAAALGTPQPVISGNTVTMTYTLSLT
jgi:hypothetical protein